jgi:hypothetical protein
MSQDNSITRYVIETELAVIIAILLAFMFKDNIANVYNKFNYNNANNANNANKPNSDNKSDNANKSSSIW